VKGFHSVSFKVWYKEPGISSPLNPAVLQARDHAIGAEADAGPGGGGDGGCDGD